MKVENVSVRRIKVGTRFRTDVGDLDALAANIREMGLLQPIGLDSDFHLIFGARRLEACMDILGWKEIPAVILRLDSVLAGEYAENEFRKQFTTSERKAIAEAIEEELSARERRGRPSKSPAPAGNKERGETADIAAKKAGLGSAETYQRAKTVVEKGTPDLVKAMDDKRVSIKAAAAIATQPKDDQKRILAMPKEEQGEVVKQIRKTKADKEADERRARDIRLFRGLLNAVEYIANFYEDPKETWAGLSRVSAYKFPEYLPRAIDCLLRIKKEHPNEPKHPQIVGRKA